jgi:hypothetical protein
MKKLYTTIIFAVIAFVANAQAPNWAWAKRAGGTGFDGAYSSATDPSGNTYVTGFYASASITFGTTTLINAGLKDIFIVKYDTFGNVIWANSIGSTGNEMGRSITTDAFGNVYLTGQYESPSINFGAITLTTTDTLGIYIVKYDSSGNALWAKGAGGSIYDSSIDINTDTSGNVYVTGFYYSPSMTFGAVTLTNADSTGNSDDIFIIKYDASGNLIWGKGEGGNGPDVSTSIATDASGNVYVTGWFSPPSITFGTTTLTNAVGNTMYIVKYDALGNVLWAKKLLGAGRSSITIDAPNNVYVTGEFFSPSITFGADTLTNAGGRDIFIVKYDDSGNEQWAKAVGSTEDEKGYSTVSDAWGNVYVTGDYFSPSITFGAITLINTNSTGNSADIFIVKYDASGNVLWAKGAGGGGGDYGNSATIDASGNLYIAGYFNSPAVFGATTLSNAGLMDIYIAKLDPTLVSIEEKSPKNKIVTFPNPSTGIFMSNINFKTIEVFNMMGELVLTDNNNSQINLQSYPKGLYLALINREQVVKLVKE